MSVNTAAGSLTEVEFWPVGATQPTSMPLTVQEISAALVADWVPSLQAAVGSAIITWPSHLLEPLYINGTFPLALHEVLGRSERQWKGFVS
jgi:hypothetical protein